MRETALASSPAVASPPEDPTAAKWLSPAVSVDQKEDGREEGYGAIGLLATRLIFKNAVKGCD